MDDFGKISSIQSLSLPGPHVRDFDAAQAAAKKAARAEKKAASVAPPAQSLVSDTAVSGEYVGPHEPAEQVERKVEPISRADLSNSSTTMERLHQMSQNELGVLDSITNEGRQIIRTRLIAIWEEMSARFERGESVNGISGTGGKGMGKYLRSIRVNPAKRRSWKFEIHREETLRLAHENPPTPRPPKKKEIVINGETEADLIAKAGVRMAQMMAGDSMTPPLERTDKAEAMAKEILDAIKHGQYEGLEPLPLSANAPAPSISGDLLTPVEPEGDDDDDDALIERYDPNREQPEGRPLYKVMLSVTGSRLEATLKKALEAFGDKLLNVEKVSRISSRADQMGDAISMIQSAKSVCEDLKEQIESWKDNLPENFQDKASQLEECMDALEQVVNSLDEAESNAESVAFPGMY